MAGFLRRSAKKYNNLAFSGHSCKQTATTYPELQNHFKEKKNILKKLEMISKTFPNITTFSALFSLLVYKSYFHIKAFPIQKYS